VREVAGTIRHLDAARARELVAAFGRPCSLDEHGVAGNVEDEVVTGAGGRVTLDCRTTQGVAAEPVANWKTHLHLHGLLRLPLSVARELAKHPGHIYLDKVATITDAVVSPEVATILATHSGGGLCFSGIRELSPDVARALVRHPILCLDVLAGVSDEVATILATHTGTTLSLRGLRDASSRAIALLKAAPSVELPRRLATSRGPEAPPSAGRPFSTSNAGLRGDDLIRALQRIAMEGDIVMQRATDQEDSAM
jgi:hypothetical protein